MQEVYRDPKEAEPHTKHTISLGVIDECHTVETFFLTQDIYYSKYKELIKKKLITKVQSTVITEGEGKGKTIAYLQLCTFHNNTHSSHETAVQLLKSGLFYKQLINT